MPRDATSSGGFSAAELPTATMRRLAGEDGVTLTELLIAIVMFVVVIGAPMTWMIVSIRQGNSTVSRAWSTTQAEVGLERLTRDLRSVSPSTTTTFNWSSTSGTASASMSVPQAGTGGATNQTVTWSCSWSSTTAGSCTRQVGSGTQVTELSNVLGVTFAPTDSGGNTLTSGSSTQAAYVGITLEVQDTSALDHGQTHAVRSTATPIYLNDGVDLRNNSL